MEIIPILLRCINEEIGVKAPYKCFTDFSCNWYNYTLFKNIKLGITMIFLIIVFKEMQQIILWHFSVQHTTNLIIFLLHKFLE